MLAVIAAILSTLGVLLNWPRFSGGLFRVFASDLSCAGVSFGPGLGPRLKLELKAGGQNGDIIPEVERESEIMEDNERKLRSTLRIMLVMVLLSLALFGAFLAAQRSLFRGKALSGALAPEAIRQVPAAARPNGG